MIILPGVWVVSLLSLGCSQGSGERKLIFNSGTGNIQIVKLLLERGTNPNAVDSSGTTPLLAAAANGHSEIVRLLLEKGADPYLRNKKGQTAFDKAETSGFMEIAEILKEYNTEEMDTVNNETN